MPHIGSSWGTNTWNDNAWAANTWQFDTPSTPSVILPSPHRLAYLIGNTQLAFFTTEGIHMATPLVLTATETGPITLRLTGSDGSTPDLTSMATVTFSLMNVHGTLVASNVALTDLTTDGEGTWTRTALQVASPGNYLGQAKTVDSNGYVAFYPDSIGHGGFSGAMITLLKPLG